MPYETRGLDGADSAPDGPIAPANNELADPQSLKEWAAAYARSVVAPSAGADAEFILFRLGEERFAANLDELDEVANVVGGIAVAHASSLVIGLTNLRGEVLPLLDTGALLDAGSSVSIGASNRTLVVRDRRGRRSGLPVDAVIGVANLDPTTFNLYPGRRGHGLIGRLGIAEHDDAALTLVDLSPLRRDTLDQF
ncbi:hypothetical protein G3480_14975 [Thiorhodococcus mannitoliphagus]|uniref:CheW-like domain-containing protein n=1 Tax=Thiorhodococcus mannitoliphagus TaxID=329406 RepID=A0A6P1DU11_9GAMM|nr:chemotaxis protein CheW [Thiorhodococcus mannitoliphagus]NEX21598.1 hypothetical protein [Thiorhodococcus mannitoliphagus]